MARTFRNKIYNYFKKERGIFRKITRRLQRAKRKQEFRDAIVHDEDWDDVVLFEEQHTEGWESF